MGSDCTVAIDNGFINIRVGAIIMKGNQFLMVGNNRENYLYSVGGRIKFGETSEEAVVREVKEETGVTMEIDRLGFIHENFFQIEDGPKKGKIIYEISFYYYMKTPEDFAPSCYSLTEAGDTEKLVWVSTDSEQQIYPEFFRRELLHPCDQVKHICDDERKR